MGRDSRLASMRSIAGADSGAREGAGPCPLPWGTASGTKPRMASDTHGHGTNLESQV